MRVYLHMQNQTINFSKSGRTENHRGQGSAEQTGLLSVLGYVSDSGIRRVECVTEFSPSADSLHKRGAGDQIRIIVLRDPVRLYSYFPTPSDS